MQTLELPMVRRDAEFRASTFNEANYTMDVCWTTGSTGRRMSWSEGPYDEELVVSPNAVRLGVLNRGAPLLNQHGRTDDGLGAVIGAVVPGTARMVDGEGIAQVKLSRSPGDADIVQKIRDKIINNSSVGYVRHAIDKKQRDGGKVPLWRVVDWEPYELSAVTVGFDAGAQFRAVAKGIEQLFPCLVRGIGSAEVARLRMQLERRRRLITA